MRVFTIAMILIFCTAMNAYAEKRRRSPAGLRRGGGVQEMSKELKVRGQTRTLSMLLVLKNKKDKINFIRLRKNYRHEITHMDY